MLSLHVNRHGSCRGLAFIRNALLVVVFNALFFCRAQQFVNLDFNSPDLSGSLIPLEPGSSITPYLGRSSEVLRGWTVYGDGVPLEQVAFQPALASGFGSVTLSYTRLPSPSPVNYGITIDAGPPRMVDLVFRQRGQIPLNASSLSFVSGGRMEMRIDGELIYTSNPNVSVFPDVDVSRFAGRVVDLDFHVLLHPGAGANYFFDVIGFAQVPEPSTWALFGVGASTMGWILKCQKRKKIF
jgi:hypothetical protein